ncbi:MAG: hypothetical protein ACTS6G_05395, partial [Candidatus Hodgkinia cicadicola]
TASCRSSFPLNSRPCGDSFGFPVVVQFLEVTCFRITWRDRTVRQVQWTQAIHRKLDFARSPKQVDRGFRRLLMSPQVYAKGGKGGDLSRISVCDLGERRKRLP